jgi:hypothetical protein
LSPVGHPHHCLRAQAVSRLELWASSSNIRYSCCQTCLSPKEVALRKLRASRAKTGCMTAVRALCKVVQEGALCKVVQGSVSVDIMWRCICYMCATKCHQGRPVHGHAKVENLNRPEHHHRGARPIFCANHPIFSTDI